MSDADELAHLRDEIDRLGQLLVQANDAALGLAGIISKVLVTEGLISREALAHAIETRSGRPDADDFNPVLMTFGRAIRMNLPGGRFDVICGGKNAVEPD